MIQNIVSAIAFICIAVAALTFQMMKLKRKVQNLEQQLKDFDVIPQTFDSSKSQ
jgi:hypothetical protein